MAKTAEFPFRRGDPVKYSNPVRTSRWACGVSKRHQLHEALVAQLIKPDLT